MSSVSFWLPFLEMAPVLAGVAASVVSASSLWKTVDHKHTLKRVSLGDRRVVSELVKAYRDEELTDAEVRTVVRAIEKAVARDLAVAQGNDKRRLKGALALAQQETSTKGHRLFKELAVEARARDLAAS